MFQMEIFSLKFVVLLTICYQGLKAGDNDQGYNGSNIDGILEQIRLLEERQDILDNTISELTEQLDELRNQTSLEPNYCEKDWIPYLDKKCIKVFEGKGNLDQADSLCTELDGSLITIQSKNELNFFIDILSDYSCISANAWIGLELIDETYQWIDGNGVEFSNWDPTAPKTNQCVQMSLGAYTLGKWMDTSCCDNNLLVCQKKQFTNTMLRYDIINMTSVIDQQKIELDIQRRIIEDQQERINLIIPIGFIYTQLPNQSIPQQLWPHMNWTDITQQYSGLFFRAEGDGSLSFGQIQSANQSWISNFDTYGYAYESWDGDLWTERYSKALNLNNWTKLVSDGRLPRAINHFQLYTTDGEIRPKNTAIKLWKRIA